MSVELIPCPHCGGDAELVRDDPFEGFCFVECVNCGARGPLSDEEHAIGGWNRRTAVTDHDFATAVHDGSLWGKCSECTERQGYYLDAETIQRQQEHIRQLEAERDEWQLKCCAEAGLHASHVFRRDELVRDMALLLPFLKSECVRGCPREAECKADDYAGGCRLYDRIEGGLRDAGIEMDAYGQNV